MTETVLQPQLADLFGSDEIIWEDEILSLYLLPDLHHVEVIPGLRDSIAQIGVQVPIMVLQNGTNLAVIDGLRRIVAARAAGRLEIPARVAQVPAAGAAALTIIANTQRRPNALSEFDAIMELMKAGHDESAVARMTGMPVGTIRKRLAIASLDPGLMNRFRAGEMTGPAAEAAAKLPKQRQRALLNQTAEDPSVRYRDILKIKQANQAEAVKALPASLFTPEPEPTPEPADAPGQDEDAAEENRAMADTLGAVEIWSRLIIAELDTLAEVGKPSKAALQYTLNEIDRLARTLANCLSDEA